MMRVNSLRPVAIGTVIPVVLASLLAPIGLRADDGVPHMGEDVLMAYVKSVLSANPTVKARDIDIARSCGVVQLSGFVSSIEAKHTAAVIAGRVLGVRAVHNNLVVESADTTTRVVSDGNVLLMSIAAEAVD
jgi:hypothetical protein